MSQSRNSRANEVSSSEWLYGVAGVVGAAALLGLSCLRVARPNEIMVKTGLLVRGQCGDGKKFGRALFVVPGIHQLDRIDLTAKVVGDKTPEIYTVEQHNLKISWIASFQPHLPSQDYKLLSTYVDRLHHLKNDGIGNLVSDRIGSAVRSITANSSLPDINRERHEFAQRIQEFLNESLSTTYGIQLTFNISEIDSTVLRTNSQRLEAEAKAATTIRVEQATQEAAQRTAELQQQTITFRAEQDRLAAEARATLAMRQSELDRDVGVQKAMAQADVQQRTNERQAEVERANIDTQTATMRARDMSQAKVKAEVLIQEAEAQAEAVKRRAEAELFAKQQQALGVRSIGEAEAAATAARLQAEAEGAQRLVAALGGDPASALKARLIESKQLPEIAQAQSEALSKANLYFLDGKANNISGLLASVTPSIDLLHKHGFTLPGWMAGSHPRSDA